MAYYDVLASPLGDVFVGGSNQGIHRIDFLTERRDEGQFAALLARDAGEPVMRAPGLASASIDALRTYFEGRSYTFALPLAPKGTAFQRSVWNALLGIAPGETASYGDIARAIARPSAVRAVGQAIGSNPIAVVVPCHRVIGSDGSLTGYASGLDRKRWLLAHEAGYAASAERVAP